MIIYQAAFYLWNLFDFFILFSLRFILLWVWYWHKTVCVLFAKVASYFYLLFTILCKHPLHMYASVMNTSIWHVTSATRSTLYSCSIHSTHFTSDELQGKKNMKVKVNLTDRACWIHTVRYTIIFFYTMYVNIFYVS